MRNVSSLLYIFSIFFVLNSCVDPEQLSNFNLGSAGNVGLFVNIEQGSNSSSCGSNQLDPANALPICFDVEFNEDIVNGGLATSGLLSPSSTYLPLSTGDFVVSGTANIGTPNIVSNMGCFSR